MPLINIPILVGTRTKYHWNNKKFNVSNEIHEYSEHLKKNDDTIAKKDKGKNCQLYTIY